MGTPTVKRDVSCVLVACCIIVLLGAGCATTRYEEYSPPSEAPDAARAPEQMALPSQVVGIAELEARIELLEAELANRVAVMEAANAGLATRFDSLAEQIEQLRNQLRASRRDPEAKPELQNPNRIYEQGLMRYNAREYKDAKERFKDVLRLDPKGDLGDNALYWMGESDYALGDYQSALEAFTRVLNYATTEKDDDAQLKLGLCHLRIGDRSTALIELKRLLVDYPESEYVQRAGELIRSVGKEYKPEP